MGSDAREPLLHCHERQFEIELLAKLEICCEGIKDWPR